MTSSPLPPPPPPKLDLGFTEPFTDGWRAKCKYMPCKVGGRPAFLALAPVLGPPELTCSVCGRTLRFLLQLYAPVDTEPTAFHRTLFLFACGRTAACLEDNHQHQQSNFRIFRSQLPKENRFYSSRPPEYDAALKEDPDPEYDPNPAEFGVQLCPVCGVRAPHRCGRCQKTSYCSREHQVLHWKRGGHKAVCEGGGGGSKEEEEESKKEEVHYEGVVFPELELLIGDNDDDDDNKADSAENSDDDDDDDGGEVAESEMSKYRDYLRRNKPSLQTDTSLNAYGESSSKSEADQLEEEEADQIAFERFKKRSRGGEVIRYRADWYLEDKDLEDKDEEDKDKEEEEEDVILWISSRNKPTSIPPCPRCRSPRRFEFQVMPQLLNDLLIKKKKKKKKFSDFSKSSADEGGDDDDHLDWGTLLVYSCPKSCPISRLEGDSRASTTSECSYVEEFIYNQPVV